MVLRIIIGVSIGMAVGACMGYFGRCARGTCPLTSNPFRGALYGATLGVLFALAR